MSVCRIAGASFNLTSRFRDGGHDVISRKKMPPRGEWPRSVCPAHMQQRPPLIYSTLVGILTVCGLCTQNWPAVFNKASMMNVGFMEASRLFPEMDCVMFQDADTLLDDDRLLMRCDHRPHHYAYHISRWDYKYSTVFIYIHQVNGVNGGING